MHKEEYYRTLDELKQTEGITEEDVKEYERTAIIRKSIDEVKRRYQDLDEVRKSPARYTTVKSKVSRCIRIQEKVARQKSRSPCKSRVESQRMNDTSYMNGSIGKISQLDVSQYGMTYSKSPSKAQSSTKLMQRDEEIKAREEQL